MTVIPLYERKCPSAGNGALLEVSVWDHRPSCLTHGFTWNLLSLWK